MSVAWCEFCQKNIDTDLDVEHFTSDFKCVSSSNNKEWLWGPMSVVDVPRYIIDLQEDRDQGIDIEDIETFENCSHCSIELTPEGPAVFGNGFLFCSWDCASEKNDNNNRRCDAARKSAKENPPVYQNKSEYDRANRGPGY